MSQNPLNAKALKAAIEAARNAEENCDPAIEAAIRAYLASQEAAAPSEEPVAPETRTQAEARIMQDYRWGNLTKLGVANHLRRAGFNLETAQAKANALASPAVAPVAVSVKDEKLERMLANWERPTRKDVMLPGTQMTCDQAAASIRAALSSIIPATKGGEDVVEALTDAEDTLRLVEQPSFRDPRHGDEIEALGLRIGFGALMSSASASWRAHLAADGYPVGGEFVAGPCHGTVLSTLSKIRKALSALSAQDTDGVAK